jgi:hypothetical protein
MHAGYTPWALVDLAWMHQVHLRLPSYYEGRPAAYTMHGVPVGSRPPQQGGQQGGQQHEHDGEGEGEEGADGRGGAAGQGRASGGGGGGRAEGGWDTAWDTPAGWVPGANGHESVQALGGDLSRRASGGPEQEQQPPPGSQGHAGHPAQVQGRGAGPVLWAASLPSQLAQPGGRREPPQPQPGVPGAQAAGRAPGAARVVRAPPRQIVPATGSYQEEDEELDEGDGGLLGLGEQLHQLLAASSDLVGGDPGPVGGSNGARLESRF